jgi:hypothetical protein
LSDRSKETFLEKISSLIDFSFGCLYSSFRDSIPVMRQVVLESSIVHRKDIAKTLVGILINWRMHRR